MMKTFSSLLIILTTTFTLAGDQIFDASFFQEKSSFYGFEVVNAVRVFVDDLEMMDLYQVSWKSKGGDSVLCDYVWVDRIPSDDGSHAITEVGEACDVDIEDITKPQLIEEN